MLYNKLSKLLFDSVDYVECFREVLNGLDKSKKALIYARSKEEADEIAENIYDVSRYPDKSKRHVVLSYAEGTYGLNDLVIYNTIVSRVPNPDILPQCLGRLNRPGQKSDILYMEYIILENTIDEASLLRLELCNNFYKNHIMPLAEFYEIAVGRKNVK